MGLETARLAVLEAALSHYEFTTKEVWAILGEKKSWGGSARQLGGVIVSLYREGRIIPTGEFRTEKVMSANARPLRVWKIAESE